MCLTDCIRLRSLVSSAVSDVKAVIAALTFMLSNAVKYDVNSEDLDRELQQMGLPKDHSEPLCRLYHQSREVLREAFLADSLRCEYIRSIVRRRRCCQRSRTTACDAVRSPTWFQTDRASRICSVVSLLSYQCRNLTTLSGE